MSLDGPMSMNQSNFAVETDPFYLIRDLVSFYQNYWLCNKIIASSYLIVFWFSLYIYDMKDSN